MNSSRYVLAASVLAACQLAQAQPVPTTPAVSAQPAPQSSSAPQSTLQTQPEKPRVAGEKTAADGKPATESPPEAEPRIIRGSGQVIAVPKAISAVSGVPVSFRFEEAPVAEVIRTVLGDILGVDYVMHPPLQGTVTLATRNPIAPDQAVFLLESALQANGLALVRDARGTFHAGRADALKGISGAVRQMGSSSPAIAPGYGAVIIPLQYIGAGEMASILRPMVSAEALVRVDTVRNLLVMMGTRTQAEGWMELVNTFDVDLLKGMSVGVFPLKYASTKEVEAALRLVSGGSGAGDAASQQSSTLAARAPGAAQSAAPASLGEGNPFFGALRIMPIDRINSILVVTPKASYLEEARRWIERLDKPSDSGSEPQLFVYPVQNGNARHLAGVLGGLFGSGPATGSTANSGVAPGLGTSTGNSLGQSGASSGISGGALSANNNASLFGSGSSLNSRSSSATTRATGQQGAVAANLGSIRVIADELNNSVLVWSTKSEFSKIEATLKRLDLPLTQVLIDASIIEVTLNDDLKYGLQWAFSGDARAGYSGIGNVGGLNASAATTLTSGFSYALRNGAGALKATISALAEKSLVKMLSNPSLMVLDNHTATISVGDQVPVQTATTTNSITGGATNTNTYQYKDTGVNLSVTPSVNAGNIVSMQIDQTVTDVIEGSNEAQPKFLQRQIGSKVAVRSGESIVLGGLIKNNDTKIKNGVPLLQDLPLVGNLFAQNTIKGVRTELLVVITPRVVRSDVDIREVSEDLRERLRGLKDISSNKEANRPQAAEPFVPATAN